MHEGHHSARRASQCTKGIAVHEGHHSGRRSPFVHYDALRALRCPSCAASTEQTHMAHALHGVHSVHRKHIAATCIALCCTSHSALRALCSYAHTVAHVITPVSLSIPLVHFVHWAHDLHPPPAVHFVHRGSMAVHMPSMQVGALGASHRHVVSPLVSGPPIALLHLVHLCPLGRYGACTVHGALTMYKCSVARPGPGWVALVGANPRSGGCGSTYVNLAAPIT